MQRPRLIQALISLTLSLNLSLTVTQGAHAFPPPLTALDPASDASRAALKQTQDNHFNTPSASPTERQANELMRQRKFAQALILLDKAIKDKPTGSLYLQRGKVYYGFCDYRRAIKDFDSALASDSKLMEPLLQKAVANCRIGNLQTALAGFKSAASHDPTSEESIVIISRGLLELNDYTSARDFLKKIIEGRSGLARNTELRYLYGLALQGSGDKDGAIAQYGEAIAIAPENFEALTARAGLYLQYPKEGARAAADALKAGQLNARNYRAFFYLAQARYNAGDMVQARDAINQALIIVGKNPPGEAVSLSAQIAVRQGDIQRAATEGALAVRLQLQNRALPPLVSRQITVIDQVTGSFESIVATPHLVIYSDLPLAKAQHYARLSESFLTWVDENLVKISGNFPRGLFILHDKATSRKFLKEKMGFGSHVHGAYLAANNAVVTYDGAGTGTLLHELMHTVLNEEKALDYWAEEGIPCLFEKVYGCFEGQSLKLMVGYPEQWYGKWMGAPERGDLDLEQIVKTASHANASQESKQRQVALYLAKLGKLHKYLALVHGGDKGSYSTFLEATLDKPLAQIAPGFKQYMQTLQKDAGWVNSLPETVIFDNERDLQAFCKANPNVEK